MIHAIAITNAYGESLPLRLDRPESSGLIVKDILGLGPSPTTVMVHEYALTSGSIFKTAKTPQRNIVITLAFLPSPTIEATRLTTYRYFQNEARVRIDVITDAGAFYIYGYVETNEPTIFSKDEGSVISILCPDPYFRPLSGVVGGGVTALEKLFEFPFSNEGMSPMLVFANYAYSAGSFVIQFSGNTVVGPTFRIHATGGTVVNPVIYFYNEIDYTIAEKLAFDLSGMPKALTSGSYLEVVCERRRKSVTRCEGLERLNYSGALTLDSAWPLLRYGDNEFSYDAESGAEYIRMEYEFTPIYNGI